MYDAASSPSATDRQTTLAADVVIDGVGIHTGQSSHVVIRPAGAGAGVSFVVAGTRIAASAGSVADTRRCTVLAEGSARISTVEHVLSALYGLGVDNAEIHVTGPELPVLDGSAAPWADAILHAGFASLDGQPRRLELERPIVYREGETWMVATPAEGFSVTCVTCYDHELLGTTIAAFDGSPDCYRAEVAPARTYGFEEEVAALLAAGLGRGGTLDNALVIHADRFSSPLRLDAEWTRHKLLDVVGDLSLTGGRLRAAVTAIRPGHRSNTSFAAMLAAAAITC
jgi:UDP-3-O-[3-hydroxymyristoyl] N-acetylglucosamine deacetylase